MSSSASAAAVPAVEAVTSEVIASLVLAAHAYMEPSGDESPDLDGAEIAIDLAGKAFDRIQSRLEPSQRTSYARLLTELRMTYVRKRGL